MLRPHFDRSFFVEVGVADEAGSTSVGGWKRLGEKLNHVEAHQRAFERWFMEKLQKAWPI